MLLMIMRLPMSEHAVLPGQGDASASHLNSKRRALAQPSHAAQPVCSAPQCHYAHFTRLFVWRSVRPRSSAVCRILCLQILSLRPAPGPRPLRQTAAHNARSDEVAMWPCQHQRAPGLRPPALPDRPAERARSAAVQVRPLSCLRTSKRSVSVLQCATRCACACSLAFRRSETCPQQPPPEANTPVQRLHG